MSDFVLTIGALIIGSALLMFAYLLILRRIDRDREQVERMAAEIGVNQAAEVAAEEIAEQDAEQDTKGPDR
jgi:hypothetical protein